MSNNKAIYFKVKTDYLILIIISILLISEAFSGPIRYYTSMLGLAFFVYLPKVLALGLVTFKICTNKFRYINLLYANILIISCAIAIYNGASIFNILFSFFMYAPLLLSYLCIKEITKYNIFFYNLILFLLISSILGAYLDLSINLPWKGSSYEIAGQEVEGNREWTSGGIDRIAGFARMSAGLAIMLCCFSFYIMNQNKKTLVRFTIYLITLTGILLTTTKGVLVAFILSGLYFLFIRGYIKYWLHLLILFIGLILPFISYIVGYSIAEEITNPDQVILLASFDDRLTNTWPTIFYNIEQYKASILGMGFGIVGSSSRIFPINGVPAFNVTDSASLYLYATFGVLGIYFYLKMFKVLNTVSKYKENIFLQGILVCLVIIGWTTDIWESVIAIFFIGYIAAESKISKANISNLRSKDTLEKNISI